jgi:hypothetical protein
MAAQPIPPQETLLRIGELEAAHDPQKRAAAVKALQEVVVGVDLPPRCRGPSGDGL